MATEEKEVPIRSYSKSELAELYHISQGTFQKWLEHWMKQLQKLGYDKNQKILTAAQVRFLFQDDVLGRP